jgi:hypothetical protein
VAGGLLLVALVLAGVVSHYASSSPDGLNRVAEDQGFADTAEAGPDRPLAGYSTSDVDDDRLSGGVAGVVGVLVVLVLAGGLTLVVRRRGGSEDPHGPVDRQTVA